MNEFIWTKQHKSQAATCENIVPKGQKCHLDAELLKEMRLTQEQMEQKDALFFIQLLFSIVDPKKSGITEDHPHTYCTKVLEHTNYSIEKKECGRDYHIFPFMLLGGLVNFDGILICNQGWNVANCWDASKENYHNPVITKSMSCYQWIVLKLCIKLNPWFEKSKEKMHMTQHKSGALFGFSWFTTSINLCKQQAWFDCWHNHPKNASYSDVQGCIQDKPGVVKSRQHIVVVDSNWRFVYGYTVQHKVFEQIKPFTQEGPAKVKCLFDLLLPWIVGNYKRNDKRRQICLNPPFLSMDDHFSGDDVLQLLGENGLAAIIHCQCDSLPSGYNKKYFHHLKGVEVLQWSRVAWFEQPIIAVKEIDAKPESNKRVYTIVHTSFQSTQSTNISAVYCLQQVQLYVRSREKGQGKTK